MLGPDRRDGIDKHDGITRRDFINGVLVAAGGLIVDGLVPRWAYAHGTLGDNICDGGIGKDPRALRGGNLPQAFDVAHWLRDERISFATSKSVSIARSAGKCDKVSGTFQILDDNGKYDVIIAGGGISGLAAAFYITRKKPGTKILILDVNNLPGGNASRDDAPPIPVISGTGGAYNVFPYADFLLDIYGTTGVDWVKYQVPPPFYCYWYDDQCKFSRPGAKGWNIDSYDKGLKDLPYAPKIVQDIQMSAQDFRNWYHRDGSPTDPADDTDPKYDYLAQMTLADYFNSKGFDPAVADYYDRYAVDALAGLCSQVNALSSISFLGAEFNPVFATPGGTAGTARHIVQWLIPGAIGSGSIADAITKPFNLAKLDDPSNNIRIRQNAMAFRADTADTSGSVVYYWQGKFFRASAKAVIWAGQSHTAHYAVEHIIGNPSDTFSAWGKFLMVPVVVANVALKKAKPLVDLGLGYDQYWWGSKFWADFVIADWTTGNRADPDRPTTLTFFGGNAVPPDKAEMIAERVNVLTRPFSEYEASLKDDLNRILAGGGFDFDRDVSAVYIYRWGHGMIHPSVGFPFGAPQNKQGQVIRTPAPRHLARQQVGRISFAGQDTESTPSMESAIGSGLRTSNEVLPLL